MMMGSTQQIEVVAASLAASASKLTATAATAPDLEMPAQRGMTMRFRILKTLLLVCAWISFGMNFEVIGSTLEDLKLFLQVDYHCVSFNLVLRNIGYLTTVSLSGFLLDRYSEYTDLFMCLASLFFAIRKNNYHVNFI